MASANQQDGIRGRGRAWGRGRARIPVYDPPGPGVVGQLNNPLRDRNCQTSQVEQASGTYPQRRPDNGDGNAWSRGRGRGVVVGRGSAPGVASRTVAAGDSASQANTLAGRLENVRISSGSSQGTGLAVSAEKQIAKVEKVRPPDVMVTRPPGLKTKKGTGGTPVQLLANYFKLNTTPNWCLYQYHVDFSTDDDRTFIRKKLFAKIPNNVFIASIFDGAMLFSIAYRKEPMEFFVTGFTGESVKINVRFVAMLDRTDYGYIQFFNNLSRKLLAMLNLQLVGRNYFDPQAKISIPEYGLELWPGYTTSIRQHESDILMCTEIIHKVIRQETILDILMRCGGERDWKRLVEREIIGLVVHTTYNNRTYRIDSIDYDTNPQSTFRRNQEEISYIDYYRTRYQVTIKNTRQPMLVSRGRRAERRKEAASEYVYLVPELCQSTGYTDDMRRDYQLMNAVNVHTRVNPQSRIERLLKFNGRLRSVPKITEECKSWNIGLDTDLVEVQGRELPNERIFFGGGQRVTTDYNADWTTAIQKQRMALEADLKKWFVVLPNHMKPDFESFLGNMSAAAAGMKFGLPRPMIKTIGDGQPTSYTRAIEEIMSRNTPDLVFCVVQNNSAARYSAIKRKCCIDRPVPSQVLLCKNLNNKRSLSIATKVVVQLNCKMGGAPWTVNFHSNDIMVVGFDVCHDTCAKERDFGAMVASIDPQFRRYYSAVNPHKNGEEISTKIAHHLRNALSAYKDRNRTLPGNIVVYRDGVGEGQIAQVKEIEVDKINRMLAEVYGAPNVAKMTYVIVTKRISTRIFLDRGGRTNRSNPLPGTVVDDVVTDPFKYDFFVVSQSVRQGTVTPTSYNVIYDTIDMSPGQLQQFTYKLTHMYYNWSGTVRVPAPCQYAHKLAFLTAQSIHDEPSSQLQSLLYYL